MSLVRQRIRVDFPDPDSPMTTKTSPFATSKLRLRTAATQLVRSSNSAELRAESSRFPGIFSPPGPKTFQRSRTEMAGLFMALLLLVWRLEPHASGGVETLPGASAEEIRCG